MIYAHEEDAYIVNESELADAARLEGVTPDIIEILYSPTVTMNDDPASPPVRRRNSRQYEITTLVRGLDRPEERRAADSELGAHLNDGWQIINITVTTNADMKMTRIVTLRRECPPPAAPTPLTASASISSAQFPRPVISEQPVESWKLTIHPGVNMPSPVPALNELLAANPIAAHIREHGIDATLDIMNERVREVARDAYEKQIASRPSRPHTLIPSTL